MEDQAKRLREILANIRQKKEQGKAKIITVTSGKGGVGKTSLTVNLALALAKIGKKTVIIDADFGFSNVNILLGANAAYDIGHVVRGEKNLQEVIEACFEGVQFISGGPGVAELMNIAPERLEDVLLQMESLERDVDYILFDTGAGMDGNILRLMDASDETLLVLTPEPTSITDAFVVLKTAAKLKEKPAVHLIVNKADSEKQALATSENFKQVVDKFLNYPTTLMGYVQSDELITKSVYELVPYVLKHPGSSASKQVKRIAEQIVRGGEICPKARGFKLFLERFKLKRYEN
jgi:flagellar biosynthesis protein FlhG